MAHSSRLSCSTEMGLGMRIQDLSTVSPPALTLPLGVEPALDLSAVSLASGAVAGGVQRLAAHTAQVELGGTQVGDGTVLGNLRPACVPLLGGGDDGGVAVCGGHGDGAQFGVSDLECVGLLGH